MNQALLFYSRCRDAIHAVLCFDGAEDARITPLGIRVKMLFQHQPQKGIHSMDSQHEWEKNKQQRKIGWLRITVHALTGRSESGNFTQMLMRFYE